MLVRPDHLSGRVTSGFGSKNVGPCPAHDMVRLGLVRVGSGWPAILCVIFGLDRVFFEFRVKNFGPYPTRHLLGSGIFRVGRVGFIGSGDP